MTRRLPAVLLFLAAFLLLPPNGAGAVLQDNGNGTVTDTRTGLIWQQGEPGVMTWGGALSYCEGLNLGGSTSWRLPDIKELVSLTDDTRWYPAIDTSKFPNAFASYYWSSTTYAYYAGYAWLVHFYNGLVSSSYDKYAALYVRCVRGGQSGGSFGHLNPTVAMTPMAAPAGTTFAEWGTGFTPNGTATLRFKKPDGTFYQDLQLNLDATGHFDITYPSPLDKSPGYYSWWAVDDTTQVKSNEVRYEIVATKPGGCSGKVYGVVRDMKQNAVYDAAVFFYLNATYTGNTMTNPDGSFAMSGLGCGSYELRTTYELATTPPKQVTKDKVFVTVNGDLASRVEITLPMNEGTSDTPVILVPGILGSTKKGSRFYPELPGTQADAESLEIKDPDGGWEDLERLLLDSFPVFTCPWDWRMEARDAARTYLEPKIEEALKVSRSGKVHIVAHSMGGLLVRSYIQSGAYDFKIDKFAMLGSPNTGSSNSYYIWEGGDPKRIDDLTDGWGVGALKNVYTNSIQKLWEKSYGLEGWDEDNHEGIRAFVRKYSPSLGQLMNTEEFLYDVKTAQTRAIADGAEADGTRNRNDFLINLNDDDSGVARLSPTGDNGRVQLRLFVGDLADEETITQVKVQSPTKLYLDGEPVKAPGRGKGDGTVPLSSATYPETSGWGDASATKSASHVELPGKFKQEIYQFLTGSPEVAMQAQARGAAEAATAGGTLSISVTGDVRFLVRDPLGRRVGVDQADGTPLNEIPGASAVYDYSGGGINMPEATDGQYSVTIFGDGPVDFSASVEYTDLVGAEVTPLRASYSGYAYTLIVRIDSAVTPRMNVRPQVPTVTGVSAAPYIAGAELLTRLTWELGTGSGITQYRVHAKVDGEGGFHVIGATGADTGSLETAVPWSVDAAAAVTTFAVTAALAAGEESFYSSLVRNNDRDHDGLADYREIELGTLIDDPDTDDDGLDDGDEHQRDTNPLLPDTDADGYRDGVEVQAGSDPRDAESRPEPPQAVDDAATTTEDVALSISVLANDIGAQGTTLAVGSVVGLPMHGSAAVDGLGIRYTPASDYFGTDNFTYTVNDGVVTSATATVTVTISSVNDPPSFTKGADQTVLEAAGAQTVPGWATGISAGPGEAGQTLNFIVIGNTNPGLFAAGPAIDAATGTLAYTPALSAAGAATVTVELRDDGGTAGGGRDTSEPQSFQITVVPLPALRRTSIGPHDGWILEADENSGTGGAMNSTAKTIRIGDDNGDRQYRGILSFDTSALPNDAVISSATLRFKKHGVIGANPFGTHGALIADIVKGAFSAKKSLNLTDFAAPATTTAALAIPNRPVLGWYSARLGARAMAAINRTGLTQFRLRFAKDDNDDGGADYLSIYSGNAAAAVRPVLEIWYVAP